MSGTPLVGDGRKIRRVPDDAFLRAIARIPARMASRLAFMTQNHHAVPNFVVREMPRQHGALSPRHIANVTGLALPNVSALLSDLEKRLFFLVRDTSGNVSWAFPVTSTATQHRLKFSTGESIFGAWAEDAFATSFVQGRLRRQKLRVGIDSECYHCSHPLAIEVDEELHWRVVSRGASPLLFEPDIQSGSFRGQNIIHDYWEQTIFFWSEEHARDYRRKHRQPDGLYLSLEQAAFSDRVAQSGLFAFAQDDRLQW